MHHAWKRIRSRSLGALALSLSLLSGAAEAQKASGTKANVKVKAPAAATAKGAFETMWRKYRAYSARKQAFMAVLPPTGNALRDQYHWTINDSTDMINLVGTKPNAQHVAVGFRFSSATVDRSPYRSQFQGLASATPSDARTVVLSDHMLLLVSGDQGKLVALSEALRLSSFASSLPASVSQAPYSYFRSRPDLTQSAMLATLKTWLESLSRSESNFSVVALPTGLDDGLTGELQIQDGMSSIGKLRVELGKPRSKRNYLPSGGRVMSAFKRWHHQPSRLAWEVGDVDLYVVEVMNASVEQDSLPERLKLSDLRQIKVKPSMTRQATSAVKGKVRAPAPKP